MSFHFYIGKEDKVLKIKDEEKALEFIKGKFLELLEVKNLSFLLGAGCSSYKEAEDKKPGAFKEKGIPVMSDLAKEFVGQADAETKIVIGEYKGGDVANLETFLGHLFRGQQLAEDQGDTANVKKYRDAIEKTKKFILVKCKVNSAEVGDIYRIFYRKILLRSGNLPRISVITTNYDLNSEIALDELGVIYCNGFSGFVDRRFNPAIFKHGLFTEMEIKGKPLTQIDNFLFLYKLHGSINWIKDLSPNKFFDVKEVQDPVAEDSLEVMIYPTPQKQEDSFGIPYSDLFREFQNKISQNNSIMVCIGYGFNDDHVNNIIFRALTLPTFRLVILGDPSKGTIEKLKNLDDSRIWIIGGDYKGSNLHYFKGFAEHVLPDMEQEQMEKKIKETEEALITPRESDQGKA